MKQVYNKIWKVARAYYKKGRPMDIPHVKWMMKEAEKVCKKEKIDDSILLPLVILHDVGYGTSKHVYFNKKLKKLHMIEGARIAQEILEKVNYPKNKIKKIRYFVSVHDNWIFGNKKLYKKYKILGIFSDLDFLWVLTPKGLAMISRALKKDKAEYLRELIKEGDERIFFKNYWKII